MHLAVVDVYRGEEEPLGIRPWELEGHGMNLARPFLQLEDRETVVPVQRQPVPHFGRQPEALVEPAKVLYGRHERRLVAADVHNLEQRIFLPAPSVLRYRKVPLKVLEEVLVLLQVDEADGVFLRVLRDR